MKEKESIKDVLVGTRLGVSDDTRLLTADEIGLYLGVSRTIVHRMVNNGTLPYRVVGGKRRFLLNECLEALPGKRMKKKEGM